MSDVSSKKFLQLIKVAFDVSTSVVRDFADCKVIGLPAYGGSVIKFLDLMKHDLYHKWQFCKPCCCCGNKFEKGPKEIDKWRFDLLYEMITGRPIVCMNGKSQLKVNGCIHQNCICNIIPRQTISLNEMDISTLSLLLRYCNITALQLESIQNLNKQRCRLCHSYSTRSLSMDEYDDVLQNLENSTLDLAMHVNSYYHRSIKEHLAVMKSYDIKPEEIKKLEEMVLHECSEIKTENSNLIKNGFKTQACKIEEAKEEMIQNQNTHFAAIKEQIQQLTASVKIFIKRKSRTTDNQCAASKGNREGTNTEQSTAAAQSGTFVNAWKTKTCGKKGIKRNRQPEDETSTENVTSSAQSVTDMTDVDELNSEVFAKQGAIPKRLHREISDKTEIEEGHATLQTESYSIGMEKKSTKAKAEVSPKQNDESEDISQIRATCQVEGEDIDESAAVMSLPDTDHFDSFFSVISAKQKCILLELQVPPKVLEDKVLFRVALRALIVKIARAGKVDIIKQSTITLHLTFKDDLTEDIIKQIQEVSNHSNISCTMDGRVKSDENNPNEDWLKEKLAWLENENVILMAENCQLFKDMFAKDEDISILKMRIENLQELMKENRGRTYQTYASYIPQVRTSTIGRAHVEAPTVDFAVISDHNDHGYALVSDPVPRRRIVSNPFENRGRNVHPFSKRRRRREIEKTNSDERRRRREIKKTNSDERRKRREIEKTNFDERRRRREIEETNFDASPRDSGSETMDEYGDIAMIEAETRRIREIEETNSDAETRRIREIEETDSDEIGRTTEGPYPFVNMSRTVPTDRLVNRRERRCESMDEYGGAVSNDEPEGPPMLFESMDEIGGTVSDDE